MKTWEACLRESVSHAVRAQVSKVLSYNGVYALSYDPIIAALSPRSAAIILSVLETYGTVNYWSLNGNTKEPLSQAQIDQLQSDTDRAYSEVMKPIDLAIPMPYAGKFPLEPYLLEADGATHLKIDYPALWEALNPSLKTSTDFTLPDMRGLVVMGASSTYPNLSTGGEYDHTLTEAELASHSHTDIGHAHSYFAGIVSAALEPVPVPVPVLAPNPIPSLTGSASANLTNTGSDSPHNNIQPYISLTWVFYAV